MSMLRKLAPSSVVAFTSVSVAMAVFLAGASRVDALSFTNNTPSHAANNVPSNAVVSVMLDAAVNRISVNADSFRVRGKRRSDLQSDPIRPRHFR